MEHRAVRFEQSGHLFISERVKEMRSKKSQEGGGLNANDRGADGGLWADRGRSLAWITAHEAAGKNRDDFFIK